MPPTAAKPVPRPQSRRLVGAAEGVEGGGGRGSGLLVTGWSAPRTFSCPASAASDSASASAGAPRQGASEQDCVAYDLCSRCSGPSAFRRSPARARIAAARPRSRPGPEARRPRLLRLAAVSGCSGPSAIPVDRQRSLEQRPRAGEVALVLKQEGEVVEARGGLGMLRAQRPLADRQRAFEQRPRTREVALVFKQAGEVVEARARYRDVQRRAPSRESPARAREAAAPAA